MHTKVSTEHSHSSVRHKNDHQVVGCFIIQETGITTLSLPFNFEFERNKALLLDTCH